MASVADILGGIPGGGRGVRLYPFTRGYANPAVKVLFRICLIFIVAALTACGTNPRQNAIESQRAPILLIGIDGFEWNVILPMMHEGRLPVLKKLMEQGAYGLLETQQPTSSPILWTSIATGKTPDKHGIRGFVHREIKGKRPLYTNADRKTKAFWNIFSDHNLTVRCIGWWLTYPVEPVRGVMIAQSNTVGAKKVWKGALLPDVEGQVYPPERMDEMIELIADVEKTLPSLIDEILGSVAKGAYPEIDKILEESRWAIRADSIYERILHKLASERNVPNITAIYFGGPDVLGHRFWHFFEPESKPPEFRPPPDQIRRFGRVIPHYYAHLDRVIGKLLRFYPENTTVMIISDHGMGPRGHHVKPPPAGVFIAKGSRIRRMSGTIALELKKSDLKSVGSILDITPTLLTLSHIPAGADMDGKVIEGILESEFLKQARLAPVPTHDTTQWLASRPKVEAGKDMDPERLEQLRALGYIQ